MPVIAKIAGWAALAVLVYYLAVYPVQSGIVLHHLASLLTGGKVH